MIVGERVRHDAVTADQAIGRLESDDAAQRGRGTNGAAGIRAERGRHQARGDADCGAARRAAGEAREIPGIARWRPRQVEGWATVRAFVGGELAEQHGAGVRKSHDRGGVTLWQHVDVGLRMACHCDACGGKDVLGPVGNAMQRAPAVARHNLALSLPRLVKRDLGRC